MAILIFVLSFVLLVAGLAGAYLSIDLIPTSSGLVYAFAGAAAVVGAVVAFALGVLAVRVGQLTKATGELSASPGVSSDVTRALAQADAQAEPQPIEAHEADAALGREHPPPAEVEAEAPPEGEPLLEEAGAVDAAEAKAEDAQAPEAPSGADQSEEPPAPDESEPRVETPAPEPTLIGRYSSAGATYMIFSDGSIEAETAEGSYKFASMSDFKQFLNTRETL